VTKSQTKAKLSAAVASLWSLSTRGGDGGSGQRRNGAHMRPDDSEHWWAYQSECAYCKPITKWPKEVLLTLEPDGPVVPDDVPWVYQAFYEIVVSDRTKQLIERIMPGHAEFKPVTATRVNYPPESLPTYWIMNCLKRVDCIDYHYTDYEDKGYDHGNYEMWEYAGGAFVLDETKIPPDVHMCRVEHKLSRLVTRAWVRDEFRKEKIRGAIFTPLMTQPTEEIIKRKGPRPQS
jgi:hypothetical protein